MSALRLPPQIPHKDVVSSRNQEIGWVLLVPEICLPAGLAAGLLMIIGVIAHACRRDFVPRTLQVLGPSMWGLRVDGCWWLSLGKMELMCKLVYIFIDLA